MERFSGISLFAVRHYEKLRKYLADAEAYFTKQGIAPDFEDLVAYTREAIAKKAGISKEMVSAEELSKDLKKIRMSRSF